jgi:hypothetical protein
MFTLNKHEHNKNLRSWSSQASLLHLSLFFSPDHILSFSFKSNLNAKLIAIVYHKLFCNAVHSCHAAYTHTSFLVKCRKSYFEKIASRHSYVIREIVDF